MSVASVRRAAEGSGRTGDGVAAAGRGEIFIRLDLFRLVTVVTGDGAGGDDMSVWTGAAAADHCSSWSRFLSVRRLHDDGRAVGEHSRTRLVYLLLYTATFTIRLNTHVRMCVCVCIWVCVYERGSCIRFGPLM